MILRVGTRFIRFSTFLTRGLVSRETTSTPVRGVWIDVGAHRGETTFEPARHNPGLVVYAFEPDLNVAFHRYRLLPNFIMIPMAVSDRDGFREFNVNSNPRTSSLLSLDEAGLRQWRGAKGLKTRDRVLVPTVRLDTFLDAMAIPKLDYLKIDAQGHDFEVLCSLGERLKDVREIRLEACASTSIYREAHNDVGATVAYMCSHGFDLVQSLSESAGQERNLVFRKMAGIPAEELQTT